MCPQSLFPRKGDYSSLRNKLTVILPYHCYLMMKVISHNGELQLFNCNSTAPMWLFLWWLGLHKGRGKMTSHNCLIVTKEILNYPLTRLNKIHTNLKKCKNPIFKFKKKSLFLRTLICRSITYLQGNVCLFSFVTMMVTVSCSTYSYAPVIRQCYM